MLKINQEGGTRTIQKMMSVTLLDTENGEIFFDEKARVPQYLFGRVVNGMKV